MSVDEAGVALARHLVDPGSKTAVAGLWNGRVRGNGFHAFFRERYKNPWRPIFCGTLESVDGGSRVTVLARPAPECRVFTAVYFSLSILMFLGILVKVVNGGGTSQSLLAPGLNLSFSVAIPWFSFLAEAKSQRIQLMKLFEK